ncbi:hypothetical protein [Hyalangium gracile]|uniref:hypothetical protein n=1 Tax=Hyalangium gracile TaxID=394092 RepID=UPI001CCEA976|nr:hypothetical protein [Hyalangium gracile]
MKRLLLTATLVLSSVAWADVPPADTAGCSGKQESASCQTDASKDGTCQTSKCWRNDYSNGPPPKSVEYDCLKCVVSPPGAKSGGCAAAPGAPLALAALLAGWWTRNPRRRA